VGSGLPLSNGLAQQVLQILHVYEEQVAAEVNGLVAVVNTQYIGPLRSNYSQ
jgi:hypothetical protein